MDIIDFHVHPYLTAEENACMYQEHFCLSSMEAMKDLKRAGITHICGSVIEAGKREQGRNWKEIQSLNQKALRIKQLYGSFYTPGFHIHPAFAEDSLELLEWMREQGFCLIGELVPYMHGWSEAGMDYASDALGRILERAGQYHMVVSYHTMNDQQAQMEEMIKNHPQVTFVAAHPGEKPYYNLHLQRMERYENAYLDLSGTGLFRYGMLAEGIHRLGAERFLFGTDYPITNPGMYVEAVRFEPISEEEQRKVLFENAARLLF